MPLVVKNLHTKLEHLVFGGICAVVELSAKICDDVVQLGKYL